MTEVANVNIDNAVLVKQCWQGDSAAMERLVLKYQNRIYNVILKMCGNPDDAAELTQDTFVKVIEKIDSFLGRSGFYTWLFRIAVNVTLNFCRRKSKFEFSSLDAGREKCDSRTTMMLKEFLGDNSSPDPAALAQNKELCDIVVESLNKLEDAQKIVVLLRDIEGMSYARIAEVLDIELGTVRSRLSRARNKLREILEAILS